jgi:hypothetical protein
MMPTLFNADTTDVDGALNIDIDATFMTQTITLIAGAYNPNLCSGFYTAMPLLIVLTSLDAAANNYKSNGFFW